MLAVLIGVAFLAAACGGGSHSSDPSTTQAAGSGSGSSSQSQSATAAELKYGQCMRSHGVPNFPEPNANGGPQQGGAVNLSSPQYQAASQACAHLAQAGTGNIPAQNPQNQAKALKYAQCMRSHGITNFPDPNSSGGFSLGGGATGSSGSSGINTSSPQFQSAEQACQALLPRGS